MNNRAFKKVNLVDLSYNLSSKVMKIPTESSRLCGSYTWAFLQIELEDDKDLPFSTISNTFLHEYIHFIQNLSTYYFLKSSIFDLNDLLCRINGIQDEITQKGVMEIPYTKPNIWLQNERYRNFRSCTDGDSYVKETLIVTNIEHKSALDECVCDVDATMFYLQPMNEQFGAKAIAESMAAIAENIYCNRYLAFPEFPYRSAEIVANLYCPKIKEYPLLLFSCCDIALMTPNPAEKFINLMVQLKDKDISVLDYHTLYQDLLNDKFCMNSGTSKNILEIYEETCYETKKISLDFLGKIDEKLAQIIYGYIETVLCERKNNLAFLTEFVEKGNIKKLYSRIIPPIIICQSDMYTVFSEDNIFLLHSLFAIKNIISFPGSSECIMFEVCNKAQEDSLKNGIKQFDHNFENCKVKPWENIKFEVCPLANIWQYLFKNSKVEFKNL